MHRLPRFILGVWLSLLAALAPAEPLAVLYPKATGGYDAVFDELVQGIRGSARDVQVYRVDGPTAELKRWLEGSKPNAIITLGREAFDALQPLGLQQRPVAGALDLSPHHDPGARGISLSVDPALFFATLKKLKPGIDRVFVVYDPAKNQWVIDRARAIASTFGLTVVAYTATDLSSAAQRYRELLLTVRPELDALWIPFDSALVDQERILPVITEQSWYRRLVVFSNSRLHAQFGALFALYADPKQLGAHLAQQALEPTTHSKIEFLHDVQRALNLRFARHLDIDTRRVSDDFDTFFPAPNP